MRKALTFFVLHTAVWTVLVLVVPGGDRIDYDRLGDASTPWMRQFVVALAVILALQAAFITRAGWWREVMSETPRTPSARMWIAPAVLVLAAVANLSNDGLSSAPRSYWVGMTLTMCLVGLTEELSFRGIMLVGARREWGNERRAVLVSSGLFGLFHLPNWLFGQDLPTTVRQVVFTALMGAVFYSLRRASGTLVACVVLHAAYDWMIIQGSFG